MGIAVLCFLSGTGDLLAGGLTTVSMPRVTIYPGDVILDDWLVEGDIEWDATTSRSVFAQTRSEVAGKVARRTLLPGAPIPLNAITTPRTVANGAKVRVVFTAGGLVITAYATALQSGGVGDIVSVRNLDSGVTVSGVVQPDGSIRVGGGG